MDLSKLLDGISPEENKEYGPLPKGRYDVAIEKITQRKNDTGWKALNLQLRVISETRKNAVLFDQITIASSSEEANEIGRKRLAKIKLLLGTAESDNWINKPVGVQVGVKFDDYKGEDKNVIWGYGESTIEHKAAPVVNAKFTGDDIPF